MFDTMKIAKKIKDARIARNMTQMNLADHMGVSYQAVSNWERGNSMPDISKLEDLCNALDLTVTELLGMEGKAGAAVEKVMKEEPLTVEELTEVAPILLPAQLEEQTRKTTGEGKKKYNLKALADIAPFLDDDLMEELMEDVEVDSLEDVEPLAPFLDEDILDQLVRKAPLSDVKGITALAPFLDEDTLDWIIRQCDAEMDKELIEELAPFLEEDTIDALADKQIRKGNLEALSGLYPFMEEDTLRKVAKALMASGNIAGMKKVLDYI